MKSKAPLVLMEQIIMLLVFALPFVCKLLLKPTPFPPPAQIGTRRLFWLNPQRSLSAAMRAI